MDVNVKEELFTVLESVEGKNVKIEIVQYNQLQGSGDIQTSTKLFYAHKSGVRLKQVRIFLNNGKITMESGALHFMKGNINIENKAGGVSGLAAKMVTGFLTREAAFKPTYMGNGEIYLEPTFGHYILLMLENEEIIVDKGMFYCCESTISVEVTMQKNISSAIAGGEGLFQTKLKGTGICVLTSPVPEAEIIKYTLNNEKLQVDGNFALLRMGNIEFSVEKTTKSLFGTVTSGEGLLQTFIGTGEVWLAPTQAVYSQIAFSGLNTMYNSSNTRT